MGHRKDTLAAASQLILEVESLPSKISFTAVGTVGLRPIVLPSGAGHDAMVLGKYVPTGMLFVQSKQGIKSQS